MELNHPNIVSIGKACSAIQALPDRVREVATRLGIEPALVIDNRPYYAEPDLARIAEAIHGEAVADIVAQRASGLQ